LTVQWHATGWPHGCVKDASRAARETHTSQKYGWLTGCAYSVHHTVTTALVHSFVHARHPVVLVNMRPDFKVAIKERAGQADVSTHRHLHVPALVKAEKNVILSSNCRTRLINLLSCTAYVRWQCCMYPTIQESRMDAIACRPGCCLLPTPVLVHSQCINSADLRKPMMSTSDTCSPQQNHTRMRHVACVRRLTPPATLASKAPELCGSTPAAAES
jgi:hypothetical protein